MARDERPKEDLIREAVALTERIEFQIAGDRVTVGFRNNGAASLFVNDEPVYHFTSVGELRRAHDDGLLKADDGRLIRMRRERTKDTVQLISTPLTQEEQDEFLAELHSRCQSLLAGFESGECSATRQVPEDANIAARVEWWLRSLKHPVAIAARPNAE